MPEGAIYVGRPTLLSNPYPLSATFGGQGGPQRVVDAYRYWLQNKFEFRWYRDELQRLRGHDLACWCPLDQPCHADVLLELLA
jgi:Domain of unknown function (DUF4326)